VTLERATEQLCDDLLSWCSRLWLRFKASRRPDLTDKMLLILAAKG